MRKRSHHENFVSVMAVHLTIGEENVAMQTRAVPIYPGKKTLQSRPGLHNMRGPGPKWRAKHQTWLPVDSEAVPPLGQHQPPPMYIRPYDAANPVR
jgi:hypothetical protein